jgi:hypothetical protein
MNSFPKNLIGHDMRPYLARKDKRRALTSIVFRRFIGAALITAAFAIVSHMASADGNKNTQIARAAAAHNNLEHTGDCYGAQSYLDASDRPEHLVSPEMAVFITLHGHGGDLTECDMQ